MFNYFCKFKVNFLSSSKQESRTKQKILPSNFENLNLRKVVNLKQYTALKYKGMSKIILVSLKR